MGTIRHETTTTIRHETTTTIRHETTTTQKLMGAWAIDRYGDAGQLRSLSLEKLPVPQVEARDVLIRVRGAEIADRDALVASGEWSVERSFPIVLGLAAAGTVVAVGRDVLGLRRGDAVFTYSHPLSHPGCRSPHHNGAWAEYMLVPFDRVARAPASLDLTHAGAVPAVGLTAYETLIDILKVEKYESVLITAAAGGVGHLAVQIAAQRGARVVATARKRNHDFLRSLGAEVLIDYTLEDFVEATRKRFPEGVDKALNGVGGATANDVLRAVKSQGHVVDLTGSVTGDLPYGRVDKDYVVRPDRARLGTIARMLDYGELKLEIAHEVPFTRAPSGLAEVLGKQVRGVVVLRVP